MIQYVLPQCRVSSQSGTATLRVQPKKYDLRIWVFMVLYLVMSRKTAGTKFKLHKTQLGRLNINSQTHLLVIWKYLIPYFPVFCEVVPKLRSLQYPTCRLLYPYCCYFFKVVVRQQGYTYCIEYWALQPNYSIAPECPPAVQSNEKLALQGYNEIQSIAKLPIFRFLVDHLQIIRFYRSLNLVQMT